MTAFKCLSLTYDITGPQQSNNYYRSWGKILLYYLKILQFLKVCCIVPHLQNLIKQTTEILCRLQSLNKRLNMVQSIETAGKHNFISKCFKQAVVTSTKFRQDFQHCWDSGCVSVFRRTQLWRQDSFHLCLSCCEHQCVEATSELPALSNQSSSVHLCKSAEHFGMGISTTW